MNIELGLKRLQFLVSIGGELEELIETWIMTVAKLQVQRGWLNMSHKLIQHKWEKIEYLNVVVFLLFAEVHFLC